MEAGLQILLFIIILLLMEELLQGPLEVGRFVGIHYMHVVNNIRPPSVRDPILSGIIYDLNLTGIAVDCWVLAVRASGSSSAASFDW